MGWAGPCTSCKQARTAARVSCPPDSATCPRQTDELRRGMARGTEGQRSCIRRRGRPSGEGAHLKCHGRASFGREELSGTDRASTRVPHRRRSATSSPAGPASASATPCDWCGGGPASTCGRVTPRPSHPTHSSAAALDNLREKAVAGLDQHWPISAPTSPRRGTRRGDRAPRRRRDVGRPRTSRPRRSGLGGKRSGLLVPAPTLVGGLRAVQNVVVQFSRYGSSRQMQTWIVTASPPMVVATASVCT